MVAVAVGALVAGAGASGTMGGMGAIVAASFADQLIAQSMFRPTQARAKGPRFDDLRLPTSEYGVTQTLWIGLNRATGSIIWLSRPQRDTVEVLVGYDSKGDEIYADQDRYLIDFALHLGRTLLVESPSQVEESIVDGDTIFQANRNRFNAVFRIWLGAELIYDARPIRDFPLGITDTPSQLRSLTIYDGGEDQTPDPVMEAHEGAGEVPAYRGSAYLVLEGVDMSRYGNAVPVVRAEVLAQTDEVFADAGIEGIAALSDGRVAVCCSVRRSVFVFEPYTTRRNATLFRESGVYLGDLPSHPWRISVAPDDTVWVTCKGDAKVVHLDLDAEEILDTVEVDDYPEDVHVDQDGDVWVTHPLSDKLTEINGSTGNIVDVHDLDAGFGPHDIADDTNHLFISGIEKLIRFDRSAHTWTSYQYKSDKNPTVTSWAPGVLFTTLGNRRRADGGTRIYENITTGTTGGTQPTGTGQIGDDGIVWQYIEEWERPPAYFGWGVERLDAQSQVWVSIHGSDVIDIWNQSGATLTLVTGRNSGTRSLGIAVNDFPGSYDFMAVTQYGGNRVTCYTQTRERPIDFKTYSTPSQIIAYGGDRLIWGNSRSNIIQIARFV